MMVTVARIGDGVVRVLDSGRWPFRLLWNSRLKRLCFAAPLVTLAMLIGGFVPFALHVGRTEGALNTDVDGIVVFTGGPSRISSALRLLSSGRAHRLLIAGVSPETTPIDLARLSPGYDQWFSCCVDLSYESLNTSGDAIQTRRWAAEYGFRSLVLVTSSYHMPRAMLELSHQLPSAALTPFPVVSKQYRRKLWWITPDNAGVLMREYLKYFLSAVRLRYDPID